jgi:hypothetical protein
MTNLIFAVVTDPWLESGVPHEPLKNWPHRPALLAY